MSETASAPFMQWFARRWLLSLSVAMAVALVIGLLFYPGYRQGRTTIESFLEQGAPAGDAAWDKYFAPSRRTVDLDTVRMAALVQGQRGYEFLSYRLETTRRRTYQYRVTTATGEGLRLAFVMYPADGTWKIRQIIRLNPQE